MDHMARLGSKDNWESLFKVTIDELFGSDT